MADIDKYKETKDRSCICCGKMVTVTKFMSDKIVKCDDCKTSGAEPNPDILADIQPVHKQRNKSTEIQGDTKDLPCIYCGNMVTVTKFASAKNVVCDDCKESHGMVSHSKERGEIELKPLNIDMSKLDRSAIPSIEQYMMTPTLISNKALRNVKCPACGHEHMKILKVLDWSIFGLVIEYQCPECLLIANLSEQATQMHSTHNPGMMYDYGGNKIEKLLSSVNHTRLHTTIRQLIKIIEDNDIKIDGIELPPYVHVEDRPVPVGFEIPKSDKEISLVEDMIQLFSKSERMGGLIDNPEGTRYIQVSDTLAKELSNKLKLLFKEEERS